MAAVPARKRAVTAICASVRVFGRVFGRVVAPYRTVVAEDTERRVRDDRASGSVSSVRVFGRVFGRVVAPYGTVVAEDTERRERDDRVSGSVSIGTSQSSGMVREVEGTNDLSLGAA